ncbi:hypothetical protein [Nesterenkonia halobia]|uniref:Uncharacterized protein n=1 Tax=Nesterenkonia halobia TaxID=37922 RepID=A0ABP6R5Z2_9MICC
MSDKPPKWTKSLYFIGVAVIILINIVAAMEFYSEASSTEASNAECECPGAEGSGAEGSGAEGSDTEGSGAEGLSAVALAVVVVNALVFLFRGGYVFWRRHQLFNARTIQRFNEATNAERVAVYVFGVLLLAFLSQGIGNGIGLDIGSSLTSLGESVMLLAIGAPVITYLTSGYGKIREIVREDGDSSA